MKKLTAEKCREKIEDLKYSKVHGYLSITAEYYLQALEIALPILEQQESEGRKALLSAFDPVHPGEFIKDMFMEPFGVSAAELAEKLDVSQSSLSRLINGKTDLSYEMALRLSKVLGRSAESWVNLQSRYSLHNGRKNLKPVLDELKSIHPKGSTND